MDFDHKKNKPKYLVGTKEYIMIVEKELQTRLTVSGRSPDFSDCPLRSMELY